jgi:ABC-type multidrug transport system ATPase subunit
MNETSKKVIWKLDGVSAAWGPRDVEFENVSFTVSEGEKVALISDKPEARNLLLRLMGGLQPRRSGELSVLDHSVNLISVSDDWDSLIPTNIRRRLGICLEVEGLLSNVTVREGLELLFKFKYGDHTEKLREGARRVVLTTAENFGISEVLEKRPHFLSSTERRIVGIARAYLSKPHVLLLENPTRGISDRSRAHFFDLFEEMTSDSSRSFLMSTDDWVFARHFCDRWIVLQDKRIIFDGKPLEFLKTKNDFSEEIKSLRRYSEDLENLIKEIA